MLSKLKIYNIINPFPDITATTNVCGLVYPSYTVRVCTGGLLVTPFTGKHGTITGQRVRARALTVYTWKMDCGLMYRVIIYIPLSASQRFPQVKFSMIGICKNGVR